MNILSLFDGISCGQIALNRANIKYNRYYAAEIDKNAMTITNRHYPDTIQLGDVTKWQEWDIDYSKIDLLCAGFCCQSWSFSGKQKGIEDPRGMLLFTLIDIFNHIRGLNPNLKFLFENVRMKKEHQEYVDNKIGYKSIFINSNLVSAQNRLRQYWTNIPNITQPEDKGILQKDILEDNIDDIFLPGKALLENYDGGNQLNSLYKSQANTVYPINDKSICLCAGTHGYAIGYINHNGIIRKYTPIECERLQTLDDNWTSGISNSARYKALGNGWTVDVIVHIFKNLI
jgi:site-specific DNA-cytosine methylase